MNNRHRLNYILDLLAEPFPEKAKRESCNCGAVGTGGVGGVAVSAMQSKRDIIENSLLEALLAQEAQQAPEVKKNSDDLEKVLDNMSDAEIGKLLKHIPVNLIDRHLNDLALFLDPSRATTFEEVKQWDARHAKDFEK